MRAFSSTNVYEAALERTVNAYKDGHRIIVAFSAGKDSTCALEMAIAAAKIAGRLPVEAWIGDEEIMYPGTYEYAERVANRPEVTMHWIVSGQACLNIFNRKSPYYWAFDKTIPESEWMRKYPPIAKWSDQMDLYNIVNPSSFPPPEGKLLYVLLGVRGSESRRRNMIIHQSGGSLSGASGTGAGAKGRELERHFRPIYDWNTKDVWFAIKEKGWDYNDAYDTMTRFGIKREGQRIAPVAMTPYGIPLLQMASKAWPEWFDKLCHRLPGVRLASKYGTQAMEPVRRPHETWEQAYQRLNVDEAPPWIAKRALQYREHMLSAHSKHSQEPLMEVAPCPTCAIGRGSWAHMTKAMYFGDPFLLETDCDALGYLEPEEMRPGAGKFAGKPVFSG